MKYVFVFPAVMIICSLVGCGMVNEITGINGRISRNTTPQVGQTVYLCAENGFGMGVSLNQDGVSLEDNDQGTVIQSGTDQYANYVLVKFTKGPIIRFEPWRASWAAVLNGRCCNEFYVLKATQ